MDARHYLLAVQLLRERITSFNTYPFRLPAVRGLHELEFHPAVTFLVGENGSGKSTLLEAIAVALGLNPEGGSRNFNFSTRASHSPLHEYLRLKKTLRTPADLWFLRAESFFNVATNIEELDRDPGGGPPIIASYGGRSLHEQSHGESFFALFNHRFGGHGLYILDEPEAALSPTRQLAFLSRLDELVGLNSQFIIATHSPILLAYPRAWVYVLEARTIRRVPYEQTEHFRITRAFLNHPERILNELLDRSLFKDPAPGTG